jgi:DNA repair protein RecN (Recombination protein N)
LQELDKADPSEGEEERVEAELKMFAGLEKVAAGRHAGLDALEGNGGALPALARLQRELQGLERHLDPALLAGQSEKTAEIRDLLSGLRDLLRGLDIPAEADPGRIDALNARLALLQRLRGKYKTDLAGLTALRARRREEVSRVETSEVETAARPQRRAAALQAARAAASALAEQRRGAARRFDAAVQARLATLGMEGSLFETRFSPLPGGEENAGLTPAGCERLEFFLAANPGEPPRPLRQCASGGEISRVMLAV